MNKNKNSDLNNNPENRPDFNVAIDAEILNKHRKQ
jgi:hypothetical protein